MSTAYWKITTYNFCKYLGETVPFLIKSIIKSISETKLFVVVIASDVSDKTKINNLITDSNISKLLFVQSTFNAVLVRFLYVRPECFKWGCMCMYTECIKKCPTSKIASKCDILHDFGYFQQLRVSKGLLL